MDDIDYVLQAYDRLPAPSIKPRQNALVEFNPGFKAWLDRQDKASFSDQLIEAIESETFYFLGEMPNVKGQCIVASNKTGKVYGKFYTEAFIEVTS